MVKGGLSPSRSLITKIPPLTIYSVLNSSPVRVKARFRVQATTVDCKLLHLVCFLSKRKDSGWEGKRIFII
jgi:hypothetical protein